MLMKQPTSADTTARSILEDRFLALLLVLLALLSSTLFLAGTARAASTSTTSPRIPLTGYCSNPSPHCYAERYWLGGTGGANTLINPYGALRCYGCAGFIDDEMWFADKQSSQCTNLPNFNACWVEAGVSTYPANDSASCNYGVDSTCMFWADARAINGNPSYHEHPLYNFGSDGTSLAPYLIYITISNHICCSSSGSTWDISSNIYQSSSWIAGPSGQSTSNTMNISQITIGSELADSNGSADTFYFQYNQWEGSNGSWNYQTTTGNNDSTNAPPHGLWATNPCSCGGNTGGSFETYD